MARGSALSGLLAIVIFPAFAGTVPGRYIVELSEEPVADQVARMPVRARRMESAAAQSHRVRVRGEQQQMRSRLEARKARVTGSVENVANALFVEAADADVAQLAATPGVKRVRAVRTYHMVMDRAVLLHRVAEVWNQVGAANAGAGIKIAIIDSGVDALHPGFQDAELKAPDGFPRANSESDKAYTNGKVIVARSYVSLLPSRDPDLSARDHVGHGTALAMVSAGVRTAGPLATISGVAPKAFIGNYKVFGSPGFNDSASDDAIIKAIDDAVADGMDIINLSLGSDLAPRLEDDITVLAVERAFKAGVIVVTAAGNNGPDMTTISSPATAPSAIAVGATTNDRTFAAGIEVPGLPVILGVIGVNDRNTPPPGVPLTAAIVDVEKLDQNGLACGSLPGGSLQGSIALILRGNCNFEVKLNNAQAAGATAALVYATEASPSPISMALGQATLPAEMVSFQAGTAIKQAIAASGTLPVTIRFTPGAVSRPPNRRSSFSAAGPGVDASIKPDLMAAGEDIYTATQSLDTRGEMYSSNGFILVDGTSFSSPMVAGAAALIKSARPGLSAGQYRSLLINTAVPTNNDSGQASGLQLTGAGLLDASAALNAAAVASPASFSFGAGSGDVQFSRNLILTNVSPGTSAFAIEVVPSKGSAAPALSANAIELASGATANVPLTWTSSGLPAGTYEGFIVISGGGTSIRVPYWYAVASGPPARIVVLQSDSTVRRGSVRRSAILFRVLQESGITVSGIAPEVSVVSGDGMVRSVNSLDSEIPGVFSIDLQMGPLAGANVFRIRAGDASIQVSITGQ